MRCRPHKPPAVRPRGARGWSPRRPHGGRRRRRLGGAQSQRHGPPLHTCRRARRARRGAAATGDRLHLRWRAARRALPDDLAREPAARRGSARRLALPGRCWRPRACCARIRRMIRTLLLLGATGDLARRYVLPALGALNSAGRLPEDFRVVGAARGALEEEEIRRLAGDAIPPHLLTYHAVDLADPSSLAAALAGSPEPVAAYLALPPGVFATTIESLGRLGLPAGSRVVIEKPFGDDLESARRLNVLLAETGLDAYRVDHVLGMETVRDLVALRRENPVLERLWEGESVEQVEILWEETLALERRAGYYDPAGALKDVLPNHMLQLLGLVGMEPLGLETDVHERKLQVLRAARLKGSRRARYTAG